MAKSENQPMGELVFIGIAGKPLAVRLLPDRKNGEDDREYQARRQKFIFEAKKKMMEGE
jgi:hypothetical protein